MKGIAGSLDGRERRRRSIPACWHGVVGVLEEFAGGVIGFDQAVERVVAVFDDLGEMSSLASAELRYRRLYLLGPGKSANPATRSPGCTE